MIFKIALLPESFIHICLLILWHVLKVETLEVPPIAPLMPKSCIRYHKTRHMGMLTILSRTITICPKSLRHRVGLLQARPLFSLTPL